MGYVELSMSLAMLVAPLLGGIVFEAAGYYAVFAMAFGLVAVDVLLRLVLIEKKVAAQWVVEDGPGVQEEKDQSAEQTRSTVAETNDVEASATPASQPADDEKSAAGVECHSSIVGPGTDRMPEKTFISRMTANLPPVLSLLASRRILSAIWVSTIQATLFLSFDAILPLFVRDTFNWNSSGAGLIFLPMMIPSFIGPVIGNLCDKHGPRWYATSGCVLACPCLILLRLVQHNTIQQKVLLCALLALIGLTLTLILTPIMAEIAYAVDAKAKKRPEGFLGRNGAYAQAYSLFNMAWAAGSLM